MIAELKSFSMLLENLGRAAGLRFAWHFVNMEYKEDVVESQRSHSCLFCRKIKLEFSRTFLRKCIQEHHEYEFLQALKLRKPFIIRCHAGAMELAVPIFIREEFIGILTAGTFRNPGASGYPEYEAEWKALPVAHEDELMRWEKVLTDLAQQYLSGLNMPPRRTPLLEQMLCSDTRILKAVIFLQRNLTRKIMVKEAAKSAGICLSRFLHLFPQETGYSFSDYLQRLRIEHARRLVEGSDLPFGEIARRSGIPSQSRMGVLFHRYLNVSPRELRKRYRNSLRTSGIILYDFRNEILVRGKPSGNQPPEQDS